MAQNRGSFKKGLPSPNPAGRPKAASSAAEINRGFMKKYGTWERLPRVAAGMNLLTDEEQAQRIAKGKVPFPDPTMNDVMQAIKLQAAYGFGQPVQMTESLQATDVHIQVTYVQQNRIEVTGTPSGSAEGIERGPEVQCVEGGPSLRQIDAGPSPADS